MNRQVRLVSRPVGLPKESDFEIVELPVPEPSEGEVLTRTLFLSLDPYMRGRMSDAKSYSAPVPIGGVMIGRTIGEVVASRDSRFAAGDIVVGFGNWQDYALIRGKTLRKLDPASAPVTTALGVLGMPGHSAYVGLLDT
jgi:NADPH-dependent curcumin reductase CurA